MQICNFFFFPFCQTKTDREKQETVHRLAKKSWIFDFVFLLLSCIPGISESHWKTVRICTHLYPLHVSNIWISSARETGRFFSCLSVWDWFSPSAGIALQCRILLIASLSCLFLKHHFLQHKINTDVILEVLQYQIKLTTDKANEQFFLSTV